jgi:hypothetical protein
MRPTATFGRNPGDDLIGIGDVTRFAVNAVCRIDFEARAALGIRLHFVNSCGAEMLAGVSELAGAARGADIEIGDLQVRRLILFVAGTGMENV